MIRGSLCRQWYTQWWDIVPGTVASHVAQNTVDPQIPELMLLRGMHDRNCDDIFIIVTDLKGQEMDDVTEYFKFVCKHTFGRALKQSMEQRLLYERQSPATLPSIRGLLTDYLPFSDMRLTHTLARHRRTPCFPQIDLTFRAILKEHSPPFIILFSHQTSSYSQIFFTHPAFVPSEKIFYDFPSGCPNPSCTEDCEMIRFPRWGTDGATVLHLKRGGKGGAHKIQLLDMCNWIQCNVQFAHNHETRLGEGSSEGSVEDSNTAEAESKKNSGLVCGKCRLVKYCSPDCQKEDWIEHKKVCSRPDC